MTPLPRAVLLAAVLSAPLAAAPAWERIAALPVGNGGFVAGVVGGELRIAGGTTWQGDQKLWLDQIWAYDAGRNAWKEAGRLEAPLAYGLSADDGQTWWFAGGTTGTTTRASLWEVRPGQSPRQIAPLDRGMVYAAGAKIGDRLYAVGGSDDQGRLERIGNAVVSIDLATGAMLKLAPYPETGVSTATAAAAAGRLFVFGGARWDPATSTVVNHRSAHAYTVKTGRWERLPDLPHPGRGYCAVTLDEGHILVAGGYRDDQTEFVADALIYDVAARRFAATTPLPYAAMVSLVVQGDWLYCLGGEDRKRHRTDAAFRLRWRELLR